jgi:hypothetical protein
MLRIDALHVVAFVADAHPIGDGAKVYLPREAMRRQNGPLLIPLTDMPVAPALRAGPQPTTFSLLDLGPESLNERPNILCTRHTPESNTYPA